MVYAVPMMQWQISNDWWERHTSQDLVYRVTFALSSPVITDLVWANAADGRSVDDGAILDGGAYLERTGSHTIEIGSGGEDGLDSLESCVRDVFYPAVHAADANEVPVAVIEERRVVRESE